MTAITASIPTFAPNLRPYPDPIDITPIILTAHLFGVVVATAAILGLIPVAIVLVRALI